MDRGYPKIISEYFPGIPNGDLDGAFEWDGEFVFVKGLSKISQKSIPYYFLVQLKQILFSYLNKKGDKFWRFNSRKRPQVQPFFPMPVSHWGLDGSINAAFNAPDGKVYFFQNSYSWEFNRSNSCTILSETLNLRFYFCNATTSFEQ